MAQRLRWFFYNGKVPIPVKLADGRSFSVRPRGYVYTTDELASKSNNLKASAAPKNGDEILKSLAIKPDDTVAVPKPGIFAERTMELGVQTHAAPVPEPPKEVANKPPARSRSGRVTVPDEPT